MWVCGHIWITPIQGPLLNFVLISRLPIHSSIPLPIYLRIDPIHPASQPSIRPASHPSSNKCWILCQSARMWVCVQCAYNCVPAVWGPLSPPSRPLFLSHSKDTFPFCLQRSFVEFSLWVCEQFCVCVCVCMCKHLLTFPLCSLSGACVVLPFLCDALTLCVCMCVCVCEHLLVSHIFSLGAWA